MRYQVELFFLVFFSQLMLNYRNVDSMKTWAAILFAGILIAIAFIETKKSWLQIKHFPMSALTPIVMLLGVFLASWFRN